MHNVVDLTAIRETKRLEKSTAGMAELSDTIGYSINRAITSGTVDAQGALITMLAMTGRLIAYHEPTLQKPHIREALLSMLDRIADECVLELWEKGIGFSNKEITNEQ